MFKCSKCGFAIDTAKAVLPTRCPRCGTPTGAKRDSAKGSAEPPKPPPPPAAGLPPPPPPGYDIPPPPASARGSPNPTIFGMPALTAEDIAAAESGESPDLFGPPIDLDDQPIEIDDPGHPDPEPLTMDDAPELPAPVPPKPRPAGRRPVPKPPPRPPAPSSSAADLGGLEEIEIEDLPAPVDLDLPAPVDRPELPAPVGTDDDRRGLPPAPASPLDDLDLPAMPDDLPAPVGEVDLLEPAGIDLPEPAEILPEPAEILPEPKAGNELAPHGDNLAVQPIEDAKAAAQSMAEAAAAITPGAEYIHDASQSYAASRASPAPRELPSEGPSRGLVYALLGTVALGLAAGGLYLGGVFDETTDVPIQRGVGTKGTAPQRDPSAPAQERADDVLAKMRLDTPTSYQEAIESCQAISDKVGEAEVALLLHLRYGPDLLRAGQAKELLAPYKGQQEPFVQRVAGLSALAAGDLATAEKTLVGDGPRVRLYRGWLLLRQGKAADALVEANAVLGQHSDDLGASELASAAKLEVDEDGALSELQQKVQRYGDHLRMRELLVDGLVNAGRLREAAEIADAIDASSAGKAHQAAVLAQRARVAVLRGNRSGGIDRYEQAMQLAPTDVNTRLAQLRFQIEIGELSEASNGLKALLKASPNSLEASMLKAELSIAKGEGDAALEVLQAIAAAAGENPRVPYLLAQVHAMRMEIEEARAAFAAARTRDPSFYEAGIAEARFLAKALKVKEALALLDEQRKAAAEHPNENEAATQILLARAQLLEQANQREAAIAALDRALEAQPGNNDALLMRGRLHLSAGRADAGRQDLVALHDRTGSFPGLAALLGSIYVRERNMKKLEELVGSLLEDARASDEALLAGAQLRLFQNKPDAAMELVDKVLQRAPTNWQAHLVKAQVLTATGDYPGAMLEIDQARPKNPTADVELWRGKILEYNGKRDEAVTLYQNALQIDSSLLEAKFLYGRLLAYRGRAKEALLQLDAVIKSTKSFPGAYLARGWAKRDLGKPVEAISDFRMATSLDPNLGEAFYWEGRLYNDKNQHGKTTVAMRKAIAVARPAEAWVPHAYRLLGRALMENGQRGEAATAFKKYLQIAKKGSPGIEEVKRMLERMK